MFHRIAGVLLVIVGLMIGGVGLYGWVGTDSMAQTYSNIFAAGLHGFPRGEFQAVQWKEHWRLFTLVVAVLDCLTAIAGVAVTGKKLWGYLFLSATAASAGLLPLINNISGYARYRWEAGSVRSALPYLALALLAIFVYVRAARGRAGQSDRTRQYSQ
jgi:hypothetical protein